MESWVLETAVALSSAGQVEFHGFLLAKEIRGRKGQLFRTAPGPLYKALDRLQDNGLLTSRWEEPEIAVAERRPRRCLFRITAAGEQAAVSGTWDVSGRIGAAGEVKA